MEAIDVSDLPAPFQAAVRAVVETFRRELAAKPEQRPQLAEAQQVTLSVCDGAVVGTLSREEIYDDRI